MANSCCCGLFSLRTGTLILLGVYTVLWAISFLIFLPTIYLAIIPIIFLVITGLGIYGSVKEKPGYLLPFLAYIGVSVLILVVTMVTLVIVCILIIFIGLPALHSFLATNKTLPSEAITSTHVIIAFIILELFYFLSTVLHIYFFMVVQSFQKEMSTTEGDGED